MSLRLPSRLLTGLAAAAALTACQAKPAPVGQPAPPPGMVILSDANVAGILATANAGAIDVAQLAATEATTAAVREFAQHLVTEHQRMGERLTTLLRQEKITPEREALARQIMQNQQQTLDVLRRYEGAAFDRTFVEHEIAMHEWLVTALDRTLIPSTRDPQLAAALQQVRQGLEGRLQRARQIRGTL